MNTIIHPITRIKININSEAGRVLLKKYINVYKSGGSYAQRHNLYPLNLQQGRFSRNFSSVSGPGIGQRIYTEIIPALNEATQSVPQEEEARGSDTDPNTRVSRADARAIAAERLRNEDVERRQNLELLISLMNRRRTPIENDEGLYYPPVVRRDERREN
tara:strand:+ start:1775 stop:2254 length:480 start_codon:yes stop_codon:yes gene_type:complete